MSEPNPLLSPYDVPWYSRIVPEHVLPAIDDVLANNRTAIAALSRESETGIDWHNFVVRLDELEARLHSAWSPVSHLNAVCSNEELRQVHDAALARISSYEVELGQNTDLFTGFQRLSNSLEYAGYDCAQRAIVERSLQNFRLSGGHLNPGQQQRVRDLRYELGTLGNRFANNVLDATQAWSRLLSDETQLVGLPPAAKSYIRQSAAARGLEGWLLTLEVPCLQAVLTHADDPGLREELYFANSTRASEVGHDAGRFDNGPVMADILRCRAELAQLLGFKHYVDLSLATKMADSAPQVSAFLRDLASTSRSVGADELEQLRVFALGQSGVPLQPWDIAYYSEKYREAFHAVSQEALRQYFPADQVIRGMFDLVERLYGLQIIELSSFDRWHPDVRLFEIIEQGKSAGRFFVDLYARPNKRAGAWMDVCRTRRRDVSGLLHEPIAYLVCNFAPGTDGASALLTHPEIVTLFHEFGHCLHHLLTRIEWAGASGINGVAWDAVELPSQFMEQWCWQPEVLRELSGHVDSGEPVPDDLLARLVSSRHCMAGLAMLRQIELGLFDLELHATCEVEDPTQKMATVRAEIALTMPAAYNRFAHTFTHIFCAGYAAGYYGYMWAAVLASDAFSRFAEEGLYSREVGQAFRETVLGRGGAESASVLFKRFRGREPRIDALLQSNGLK